MTNNENIKRAIFNLGGPKLAARELQVSTSAIGKWIRAGVIPNLEIAKRVAQGSGFDVTALRPRFDQKIS